MFRPHALGLLIIYFVFVTGGFGAPRLRLQTAVAGPVSIAPGQNGPSQIIEAANAGDGALNLSFSSSAPWVAASAGAARPCGSWNPGQICLPVTLALQTSSLPAGLQTAEVTVRDPNAVDAPQSITVTVAIGGNVPSRVELFAAPGGLPVESRFTTNSSIQAVTNQPWLSLAVDGGGSFDFVRGYRVRANPANLGAGSYSGALTILGSSFAADNRAIAVSLVVTAQPIARVTTPALRVRRVANTGPATRYVAVENVGLGTLTVTGGADPNTVSGGNWLSTGPLVSGFVPVTVDVTGLGPGRYRGRLNVISNAANGPQPVEVELEVVAAGPPEVTYQGVLDNATFARGAPLARGMIAAVFGLQFRSGDPVLAPSLPLGTELGGARVLLNGRPAPVYYVQDDQINFQIPYDTPPGLVEVRVEREGQRGNAVGVEVVERAPRLLRLGIADYGIIVNQDGTFPLPATPGIASRPARPGDALTIYAFGLGQTTPAVNAGTAAPAAEPLARIDPVPQVVFGGGFGGTPVAATPFFAGLTPGFVGLYQINVFVPPDAPTGRAVPLSLDQGVGAVSNQVTLAIE